MPFLAINSIPLTVKNETYEEKIREIGETEAAYDGTLRKSRQTVKRDSSMETPPMLSTDAIAWDSLLRGLGERYSFDSDLYSSKGGVHTSNTDTAVDATRAKFGAKSLKLTATTGDITWPNTGAATPGACYFFWHWNGATWDAWAYNYESAAFQKYKNYVATGTTPSGITVTAALTSLRFQNGGADSWVDDLVVLPFSAVAAWITTDNIPSTSTAFSDLPKLLMTGDAVNEQATRTIMANVASSQLVKAVVSGSFRNNARILNVETQEA